MLLSQFPRSYHRFLSLPLLGPSADGLDDWLATKGYTRGSRQNSILRLPHVDAELRRRGVDLPNLRTKRLHPHCVRHSTAVALLKSGVDLSTINQYLGHSSPTTTNRYAKVDLEMKRRAISRVKPVARHSRTPWTRDPRFSIGWSPFKPKNVELNEPETAIGESLANQLHISGNFTFHLECGAPHSR
jgi:hypothetical protein